ncbi:MAG: hypothetical protein ABI759_02440 [Candidatus Solibacter sp.]
MSNLHGKFLSIHKISQAYPGIPKAQRGIRKCEGVGTPFGFLGGLAPWREDLCFAGGLRVPQDAQRSGISWQGFVSLAVLFPWRLSAFA